MERFAVKGIFVDTPTPDTLRVRDGYMLCEDGRCGAFREAAPAGVPVYDHSGQIITPGFVDLHLHAPQYSYCGTAMDLELLDWLQQYTYPEESHYADADYARAGYGYFVRDLTHSATTRACIFGTLHTDATLELMHQLKAAGLSAFVGKLGMDRNSPDFYREPSPAAGLAETRRWLDTCADEHMLHDGPVRPMITPRFTPSASDEYMKDNHMQLLDEWRNDVVRDGSREYESASGQVYEKSLDGTCLECHSNREEFCDSCHDYASVDPYCWDCHDGEAS